ncbi:PEP-CTERM sorting domain-containing protein [Echinimonas agarilytica]|uniref:PEP-CTERM sorting domain-containing protein n=1 Tax=Echinimonas agarilytica TaxID=1215918 RepID=A0AA42B749_9GAMM|nr:PEP-CTERM sorting domain-containing protein [Echinimonas agarilytica]MCM2679465.1 PEP-CTERM sorting domain-containing protein [Echinimonas agarilytica]
MLRKLIMLIAATQCIFAINANAAVVDGVNVTSGPFVSTSDTVFQFLEATPDSEFMAWGIVDTSSSSTTCGSCELTFVAKDYVKVDSLGSQTFYRDGTISFYVDQTPNFDGSIDTAQDGSLWLELAGHNTPAVINGISTMVSFIGTINTGFGSISSLTGEGIVDVVGGPAAALFDTNEQVAGSDLLFSSTFTANSQGVFQGQSGLSSFGSGTFTGETIPEPAAIALFGLGLIGMAGASRRRYAKK